MAFAVALCISLYRKRQDDYHQNKIRIIQNIKDTVAQIVEDDERKKQILEKIKKVGIYQCDKQNLHLR